MTRQLLAAITLGISLCACSAYKSSTTGPADLLNSGLDRLAAAPAVHVVGTVVPPSQASGTLDVTVTYSGVSGQLGESDTSVKIVYVDGHYYRNDGGTWAESASSGDTSQTTALCAVRSTTLLASFLRHQRNGDFFVVQNVLVDGRAAQILRSGPLEAIVTTDAYPDILHATVSASGRGLAADLSLTRLITVPIVTAVAGAASVARAGSPLSSLDQFC